MCAIATFCDACDNTSIRSSTRSSTSFVERQTAIATTPAIAVAVNDLSEKCIGRWINVMYASKKFNAIPSLPKRATQSSTKCMPSDDTKPMSCAKCTMLQRKKKNVTKSPGSGIASKTYGNRPFRPFNKPFPICATSVAPCAKTMEISHLGAFVRMRKTTMRVNKRE